MSSTATATSTDDQLHLEMATVRRQLAALPSPFDRCRAEVKSFAEALDAAAPEKLRELVALLVERVENPDRSVACVIWTGPAQPFFVATAAEAAERSVWGVAPPDGLGGAESKARDPLAWYAVP